MESYRRHIVVDNVRKVIYIEVQANLKGDPKPKEYADLKAGRWWDYVPGEFIDQFRDCIGNGYVLEPVVNQGGKNEKFYFIQLTALTQKNIIL